VEFEFDTATVGITNIARPVSAVCAVSLGWLSGLDPIAGRFDIG
jgi:hypothetical protein